MPITLKELHKKHPKGHFSITGQKLPEVLKETMTIFVAGITGTIPEPDSQTPKKPEIPSKQADST